MTRFRMRPDALVDEARRRPMASARVTEVLILGVAPTMRGGVASVLDAYRRAGLGQRFPLRFVQTADDGGPFRKGLRFLSAVGITLCVLIRGRVGLAHIHTSSGVSFWRKSVFVVLCRCASVPVLLHVHGGGFIDFIDGLSPIARAAARWVLSMPAAIVALTPHWHAQLQRISGHQRVEVVSNGVPLIDTPAARVGDASDRDVVLFMGLLCEEKGVGELIEAFSQLATAYPHLRLVCAGNGDVSKYRRESEALGLHARVDFPGWIGDAERTALLDRARVLALPSHAENLPMALLEAMARGVPVVATPVGGVPDAVQHGRHGLLVSPGDVESLAQAIEAMLDDDMRWVPMSRAAHRHAVERYSAPAMVESVARLYERYTR